MSVNRYGNIAIYVNGELSVSRDISDRQDEEWINSVWWSVTGNNKPPDTDNPIAKMDISRLSVRTELMSMSQIKEEADLWLSEVH